MTVLATRPSFHRFGALLAVLAALAVPAAAWAADATSHPGFVDGAFLKQFAADDGEFVEVTLDRNILKMFSGPATAFEKSVGDVVSRLESLRALVIELRDDAGEEAVARVDEIRAGLERDGWQQVARVRDGDERVNVLFRTTDDVIHGITVLILDGNELVFTNIAGELRAEDLQNLTERFAVPGMEAIGTGEGDDADDE